MKHKMVTPLVNVVVEGEERGQDGRAETAVSLHTDGKIKLLN